MAEPEAVAIMPTMNYSINFTLNIEEEEFAEGSPPKSIRDLKFVNNVVADTLSIAFNILMLFIINTQARNQLKQYRKVLLMNTIVDLIYSIITILFMPTTFVVDGYFFMVMEGFFQYWPQPFTSLFCHSHLFMLYVTLTVVPVQFIYRYLLICRNVELSNKSFLVLVGFAILVSGSYAGTWLVNFWPKETDKILGKYLDNSKWWLSKDHQIPPFAVAFYDGMNYVAPFSAIIMLVIYIIVIFCSVCIMISLHQVRHSMSIKTRQLQKQISRVLFVQAFVPFVTMVIPLIFDILTIYFEMYMPDSGTLFLIASSWSPVVNPVVTLLVVTQYRHSVIEYFNRFSPIKIDVKQSNMSLTNMNMNNNNSNNIPNQFTAISA